MKTAADAVDEAIINANVRNQKAENLRVDGVLDRRLASARDEAKRLAAAIGEIPGVRKVLLFGFVASGKAFTSDSDIELARLDADRRSRLLSEGWSPYDKDARRLA
jgi:hypothetical protein